MADANIELSKDGVKLPYRRYLSDSAPGFFLVLLLIAGHYSQRPPFDMELFRGAMPSEVKVFVLLLLFLLSTPIGVIANVAGWLLLEGRQEWLEMRLLKGIGFIGKSSTLVKFKQEYGVTECNSVFGIKAENWFESIRTLETALINDFPGKSDAIEALRAIAILLRTLSLMSVFLGIYFLAYHFYGGCSICWFIWLAPLAVILFCLSGVVSFYFHVQIVRWAFILRLDENAKLLKRICS